MSRRLLYQPAAADRNLLRYAALLLAPLWLAGCSHQAKVAYTPPPPALPAPATVQPTHPPVTAAPMPASPAPSAAAAPTELAAYIHGEPISVETGTASWYGPPYNKHRGANGEIYDQDAMTAAHRTLPMNSVIRVTNLSTGQSAVVRITDRGPFIPGRTLDLSLAAARSIGVWRNGTAKVKIETFYSPAAIDQGGRWCVQVGAFLHGHEAEKLRDQLSRKYHTANVIEFTGPTGHWVRIRPANDDKGRAFEIASTLVPKEGNAFLVRLD